MSHKYVIYWVWWPRLDGSSRKQGCGIPLSRTQFCILWDSLKTKMWRINTAAEWCDVMWWQHVVKCNFLIWSIAVGEIIIVMSRMKTLKISSLDDSKGNCELVARESTAGLVLAITGYNQDNPHKWSSEFCCVVQNVGWSSLMCEGQISHKNIFKHLTVKWWIRW